MPNHPHGIDVLWDWNGDKIPLLESRTEKVMAYLVKMKANTVAINFHIYISGPTTNAVYAGPTTPPASALKDVIAIAKSKHLAVEIRPQIIEANPALPWRGELNPTNLPAFLSSYDSLMQPYLVAAEATNANSFVVQSELATIDASSLWKSVVIPFDMHYYAGTLIWNVAWESVGINAVAGTQFSYDTYPSVKLPYTASIGELLAAWNAKLESLPLPVKMSNVIMQEVGIAAQDPAYTSPNAANWYTAINPVIQENWFTTACRFYHLHKMKGIFYWTISLDRGPQTKAIGGLPTDFQGLGTKAIEACFK
jgi:hypothetical protein